MVLSPTKKPKEIGRSFTLLNTRLPDAFSVRLCCSFTRKNKIWDKTFKEKRPEELIGLIIGHCKPH